MSESARASIATLHFTSTRGHVLTCGLLLASPGEPLSESALPSQPYVLPQRAACRHCGLSPAEAITAAIWNAAIVLGIENEAGSLEVGKRANIQVIDERDPRAIAWEFGSVPPPIVLLDGQPVQFLAESSDEESE